MKGYKKNSNFEITPIKKQLSFAQIEKRVFKHLYQKYLVSKLFYGKLIAHNIIYNQKTHIVAKFKDYLILDDLSEFLKRYYFINESLLRLPSYLDYYYRYSYIFPNYTALIESKFIYKNIHRKQKIIDFQQEEEFKMRQKEFEELHLKHQRKKNKQQINYIFNNDVYNSIIKQSNDLYTLLFGSEKNKNINSENKEGQKSLSSLDIKNIINSIEKYDFDSKIGYNYNYNHNINSKKDKKKENNSSLMTKQSTFNSSIIYKKIKKLNKFHSKKDDNIIGLKKMKNEDINISNSLLISSMLNKNTLLNKLLRSLKPPKKFISNENSKSISKHKDFKNMNKIKVNQKSLINDKKNYLTDRTSIHKRQKTLQFDLNYNKQENISNHKSTKLSKKMKSKDKKKSSDFKFYSKVETNPKAPIHKRINTISQMTESNYKSYKMKLLNKAKAQNYIEYNNKIKLNLKEMRELINNNKVKEKYYNTERGSLILTSANTKKDSHNKKNEGNSKKMINSNFKNNLKDSFIPLHLRKENLKLKYNQILTFCNNKKTHKYIERNDNKIYYTEGSSILLPLKEKIQEKLKRKAENMKHLNDFSVLNNVKIKHFNTAKNSQSKDKPKKIINYTSKNNDKNNEQNKKRIFNGNNKYKQIKRKEISPIKIISNNTEKIGKNIIVKMMINKMNK